MEEIDYEKYLKPTWGKPKLGDHILMATKGIWEITHVDKNGHFWTGGINRKETLDSTQRIISKHKIEKLKSVERDFKIGDYVEGLNDRGELVKGEVNRIFWTSIESPFYVLESFTGYTQILTRESVKKSKPEFSFTGWLRNLCQ